jgi:hypothetical protein
VANEDIIHFFERFESAETRKTGTQESTPAFYSLLTEMLAAEPPLLAGKPELETTRMREQCVRFRDGLATHGPAGKGNVFLNIVKSFEAEGTNSAGQDSKEIQDIDALADGAFKIGRSHTQLDHMIEA